MNCRKKSCKNSRSVNGCCKFSKITQNGVHKEIEIRFKNLIPNLQRCLDRAILLHILQQFNQFSIHDYAKDGKLRMEEVRWKRWKSKD